LLPSTDRCDQVVTSPLAAAADVSANAALVVMGSMPLAFVTAGMAGCRASFDHRPEGAEIRRGLTYHDTGSGVAGVGAVEAEADAARHLVHVVLREIGVGTTRAAGGTVEALLDTVQERLVIDPCRLWMCLDYVLNCHVLSSRVRPSTRSGNRRRVRSG
jgi:hypothetical protein